MNNIIIRDFNKGQVIKLNLMMTNNALPFKDSKDILKKLGRIHKYIQ